MRKIFISYRRQDSEHITGRIYDRLVEQFGPNAVFKDVDSIRCGRDFRGCLAEHLATCDVLLAVIGPDWMGSQDNEGKTKLDDPTDFIRIEVESALHRQIPVIPVLVRDAKFPPAERLPGIISNLSYRQGLKVHADPDFHHDMDRLIDELKKNSRLALISGITIQLELRKWIDRLRRCGFFRRRPSQLQSTILGGVASVALIVAVSAFFHDSQHLAELEQVKAEKTMLHRKFQELNANHQDLLRKNLKETNSRRWISFQLLVLESYFLQHSSDDPRSLSDIDLSERGS